MAEHDYAIPSGNLTFFLDSAFLFCNKKTSTRMQRVTKSPIFGVYLIGDQIAIKTKKIIARYLLPLGACSHRYYCQQKSLNMAELFYTSQFSLSLRC